MNCILYKSDTEPQSMSLCEVVECVCVMLDEIIVLEG